MLQLLTVKIGFSCLTQKLVCDHWNRFLKPISLIIGQFPCHRRRHHEDNDYRLIIIVVVIIITNHYHHYDHHNRPHSQMSMMASQMTGVLIACSTIGSSADKKSFKLCVTGLCEGNSPVMLAQPFVQAQIKKFKLCVTGLCEGNSPMTTEFPSHRASNAEKHSIWWRHSVIFHLTSTDIPMIARAITIPARNQYLSGPDIKLLSWASLRCSSRHASTPWSWSWSSSCSWYVPLL